MTCGRSVGSTLTNASRMPLRAVRPQIDHFCAQKNFSEVRRFFSGEANCTAPLLVMDYGMREGPSAAHTKSREPGASSLSSIIAPITLVKGRFCNGNGDE